MSQPPAEVIQRNPVEQHVPRKAVPQRMGPTTPALGDLAGLCGPKDRLLHPRPDSDPGHIDQPALPNGPETGGGGQGRLQFRMDRGGIPAWDRLLPPCSLAEMAALTGAAEYTEEGDLAAIARLVYWKGSRPR